jgi:hypothetical protein
LTYDAAFEYLSEPWPLLRKALKKAEASGRSFPLTLVERRGVHEDILSALIRSDKAEALIGGSRSQFSAES